MTKNLLTPLEHAELVTLLHTHNGHWDRAIEEHDDDSGYDDDTLRLLSLARTSITNSPEKSVGCWQMGPGTHRFCVLERGHPIPHISAGTEYIFSVWL